MNKKNLKYLIPITVTIIILTFVKISEPEEVDWTESFSKNDKIPYGGYIIYDISSELFGDEEIGLTEFPIYNVLKEKSYYNTNYIFINSYFSPDVLDTEYLLNFVAEGNQVFISAFAIYGSLTDSLRVDSHRTFFNEDSVNINFSLPELISEKGFLFEKGNFENYFSEYDTSMVQVLGTNDDGKTNESLEKDMYELLVFEAEIEGQWLEIDFKAQIGENYKSQTKDIALVIHNIEKLPKRIKDDKDKVNGTYNEKNKTLTLNVNWNTKAEKEIRIKLK